MRAVHSVYLCYRTTCTNRCIVRQRILHTHTGAHAHADHTSSMARARAIRRKTMSKHVASDAQKRVTHTSAGACDRRDEGGRVEVEISCSARGTWRQPRSFALCATSHTHTHTAQIRVIVHKQRDLRTLAVRHGWRPKCVVDTMFTALTHSFIHLATI